MIYVDSFIRICQMDDHLVFSVRGNNTNHSTLIHMLIHKIIE